jgi:cell division protein FtsW (lipid II flippase)
MLSIPTLRVGNRLIVDPRPLLPLLLAWGFCILVLGAERDIGFAVLIFVLFIALLWLATGRLLYLLTGAVLFIVGGAIANAAFAQVSERIANWLHPMARINITGGSFQLWQGFYGLGTGGLIGTGLGFGHTNLQHIPEVGSDYIFAAFGTEWGLLGTSAILVAFLLIVGSGLRISQMARSEFASLTAAGLTVVIGMQAFFIMAGVVQLVPLTGITLPFLAYGGSSIVANYVLIALLMRISAEASTATFTQAAVARRL